MKTKSILIILLLITSITALANDWSWGNVLGVSQIPSDTIYSSDTKPKTGNNKIAVDDQGNVIVVYAYQVGSVSKFAYKVKSLQDSSFPNEISYGWNTISVPLKLISVDGQIKALYYIIEGTKRPIYMSTWNSTTKSFENPVKIGFEATSMSRIDYIKHNDIEYIVVNRNNQTDKKLCLKINNGAGWTGDSIVVCSYAYNPQLVIQNETVNVFYLNVVQPDYPQLWLLERRIITNGILSESQTLYNESIFQFKIIKLPDESLRIAYRRGSFTVFYGKIESQMTILPQTIYPITGSFDLAWIDNKVHIIGAGNPSNIVTHWSINQEGTSAQQLSSFTYGDAQSPGNEDFAICSENNRIHTTFLYYEINDGFFIGANTYYNCDTFSGSAIMPATPQTNELFYNYPNPFNPQTMINYTIKDGFSGLVKLKIYNAKGEVVQTITNNVAKAGHYSQVFNGSNFSSGIYYYGIEAGDFKQMKKMVMVK